jgi:hypothetical protein
MDYVLVYPKHSFGYMTNLNGIPPMGSWQETQSYMHVLVYLATCNTAILS